MDGNFFERVGRVAIGSRLRMLTDAVTRDAALIYELYGVELKPKWFPVFYSLIDGMPKTITCIANEIGHSHPSVSVIVKELSSKGLVVFAPNADDKRCSLVELSDSGRALCDRLKTQVRDCDRAVEQIISECDHDLWAALGDFERALSTKSLLDRVCSIKAEREADEIQIVDYDDCYRDVFVALNRQWIEMYWQLEPHDIEMLQHPRENIIDNGGMIFVALYNGRPVGVCAMCRMGEDSGYDFELAKLAVSPDVRGRRIGYKLCKSAIDAVTVRTGARNFFLESNTRLKSAIALYRKLGFTELKNYQPAYERGDIQMELCNQI